MQTNTDNEIMKWFDFNYISKPYYVAHQSILCIQATRDKIESNNEYSSLVIKRNSDGNFSWELEYEKNAIKKTTKKGKVHTFISFYGENKESLYNLKIANLKTETLDFMFLQIEPPSKE